MFSLLLVICVYVVFLAAGEIGHAEIEFVDQTSMPAPFTRPLRLESPFLAGVDVSILQHLLVRSPAVTGAVPFNGLYNQATAMAVGQFADSCCPGVSNGTEFTQPIAQSLLQRHLDDGYIDHNPSSIPSPYLYKVWIPVQQNRSVETMAQLFVRGSTAAAFTFRVRAHGQNFANGVDINQLTSNGNTPTGLMEFDLNSPESDPALYGPYPVNRAIAGLAGNALFLLRNNRSTTIRSGILMHTGKWAGWAPPAPMPNSHGCVHSWPSSIKRVWHLLVDAGVQVRPNTNGKLPYPYQPQGLLSLQVN